MAHFELSLNAFINALFYLELQNIFFKKTAKYK